MEKNIDYKSYFRCMGIPSKPIESFINAKIVTDDKEWAEYIEIVAKHPDEKDIENAKKFAKEIIKKC